MIDIKDNNSTRERIIANIAESKKSRTSSNYNNGLNYEEHKLSSKGFDKLMEQRGVDATDAKNAKQSFNKWAPKENKNPKMAQDVTVKHTPENGEKGYVYSTKGGKPATGNYVSPTKQSSPETAKEKLALPANNKATQQNEVRVYGDQIRGTVAPQNQWSTEAATKDDNTKRNGGGTQILTNGGYKTGAVKDVEKSKIDMKKSSAQMSTTSKAGLNTSNTSGKQYTKKQSNIKSH